MSTFKVSGVEYVLRKVDDKFVYGSKLVDGKATRGRPSKFTRNEVEAENPGLDLSASVSAPAQVTVSVGDAKVDVVVVPGGDAPPSDEAYDMFLIGQ